MNKFYLTLATIFAILFLITFFALENANKQLKHFQKLNKAYEMYINRDLRFKEYIEQNQLNELKYLLERE